MRNYKIELVAMLTNKFTVDETNKLTTLLKLDRDNAFKALEKQIKELEEENKLMRNLGSQQYFENHNTELKNQIKKLEEIKEHYMKCNRCGDYFDMRNFARVGAHEICERLKPFKQATKIN